MKITIIGAGNIGGSLVRGWSKQGLHELTISDLNEEILSRYTEEFPGIKTSTNNSEAVKGADVIVLAVKPWLAEKILAHIKYSIDFEHQVIVSIAANVLTDKLRTYLGCQKANVFYMMPNIAAEFNESMTYLAPADGVSKEIVHRIETLMLLLGKVRVCRDTEVAAGNMMSGCGIAYVMRFLHAMMEGGVEMGIAPAEAQKIAMQTMKGAVAFLEGSGLHPAVAIDKVTTPGGLTIRGLNQLDHDGFNSAVINCLKMGLVE